jgi:uncharacterized protein (DUF1778 family)
MVGFAALNPPHAQHNELRLVADCSCVDISNTNRHPIAMKTDQPIAEVNIHLRARAQDRMLIDRAAELLGANRSQFMLASALKEAKNVLLDQTTLYVDSKTFQKVLDWLDAPATPGEEVGMKRLLATKAPWSRD